MSDKSVALCGELSQHTLTIDWWQGLSEDERTQYRKQGRCEFDFSQVDKVDSAGLAWTLNAIRDAAQHSVTITLCNLPEKMLKLAKISELDAMLPVASGQ